MTTLLLGAHPISKEALTMINQSTLETLRNMRLSAMAQSFEDQLTNSETYHSLSFEERFGLLVEIGRASCRERV